MDAKPAWLYGAQVALLAAAYFVAARASLVFAIPPGYATAVWPPSGIALAALWLRGPRFWPGVWLGAAAVNYSIGGLLPAALAIATGNTLEGVAGAWLTRRLIDDQRGAFADPPNVFRFLGIAFGASALAACVGTATLALSGALPGPAAGATWLTWWLGDTSGIIVVCPLVASLARPSAFRWTPGRALEFGALMILLVATAVETFTGWLFESQAPQPITYVLMSLVVWCAIRFGERQTLALCALVSLIAIAATVTGRGPFAGRALNESLLQQEVFVSMLVATGLILAAIVAQRERVTETLRRTHAELQDMMHLAAHDLQEPLRSIINSVDVLRLKHREHLDPDAVELLSYIVGGAARGRRLIDELLAVAEAGRRPLALERVDSGEALRSALDVLRDPIREAGADVAQGPMPAVRADRRMLESIFRNLVGNALKFRSAEPPRVLVSARRDGAHWLFSVRDNGMGIDPRYREAAFRLFERLGRDPSVEGTGAGLTLCKRMVERHGGRIWIESGPGTTVSFTLPGEESADAAQ